MLGFKKLNLREELPQPQKVSFFARKGENLLALSQITDMTYALEISNFLILSNGIVDKRGGHETVVDDGTTKIWAGIKIGTDYYYLQGDKLRKFDGSAYSTITTFSGNITGGKIRKFGGYIYVASGVDPVGYVTLSSGVFTSMATAPIATELHVVGTRLYANDIVNISKIWSAGEWIGVGIPFTNWTVVGSPAAITDPFQFEFGSASTANSMANLGRAVIVLYDDAVGVVRPDSVDITGTGLSLDVKNLSEEKGIGGDASVTTKYGVFYFSEGGLFKKTSNVGAKKVSPLFGKDFLESLNPEGATMEYDEVNNLLFIFCKNGATFNNLGIVYNIELDAYSRIEGWYLSEVFRDGNTLYGCSELDGKIYQLFTGRTDSGDDIACRFRQELTNGDIINLRQLYEIYAQGSLNEQQTVNISISIYDKAGVLNPNYKNVDWTVDSSTSTSRRGVGLEPIGGVLGSTGTDEPYVESFLHKRVHIFEYSRIIVDITETSGYGLRLNWFSLGGELKGKNLNYTN